MTTIVIAKILLFISGMGIGSGTAMLAVDRLNGERNPQPFINIGIGVFLLIVACVML